MTELAIWGEAHLKLIDLEINHLKFYELKVLRAERTAHLVRHWGRIGTKGQLMIEELSLETVKAKAIELILEKKAKGYEVTWAVGFLEPYVS